MATAEVIKEKLDILIDYVENNSVTVFSDIDSKHDYRIYLNANFKGDFTVQYINYNMDNWESKSFSQPFKAIEFYEDTLDSFKGM